MRYETTIVVPCYNERGRFDSRAFLRLAVTRGVRLVLVDDGSTDGTGAVLETLAERCPSLVEVVTLERNRGKGEAVRRGLERALAGPAEIVGYLDADLSTPIAELERLIATMLAKPVQVLIGSRVKLLGRTIERRMSRHYSGRVFATMASIVLALPVYDTQCGAKLFRRSAALEVALRRPFASRWAFDVELLQRLLHGDGMCAPISAHEILEEPLETWHDVPGSKLRPVTALAAGLSLVALSGPSMRRVGRALVRRLRSRVGAPAVESARAPSR